MNSENSILPDTWTKVSLEEINFKRSETIDPSKEPNASFELYSVPSFDYRQPEEIYGKEIGSTKQIVNVDDVLICKINPRINRVWRVSNSENSKKIASSEWIVINSKGFINSDYLRYAFSAPFFRLKLNSEVSGVGGSLTRARPKLVKDYKIPLAPLNEQNRIVEKLDALFARIDSIKERMETIPELIRQFRQSVLHAAVTGKLTEEWRINNVTLENIQDRYNEFSKKKIQLIRERKLKKNKLAPLSEHEKKSLPEIPKTWQYNKLGEACYKIFDGTHFSPKNNDAGEFMYVTAKNIKEGRMDLSNISYVSEKDHKEIYSRCDVKQNDVLYIKDGATTGIACVNDIETEFSLLSSVGVFRTDPDYIRPIYLQHYLNASSTRRRMLSSIAGIAITRLTLVKLNNSVVAVPPIEEQDEITKRVEILFNRINKIEKNFNLLKANIQLLPQTVLNKAFKGELVSQGPNDEPAEKLLERILQEKTKLDKRVRKFKSDRFQEAAEPTPEYKKK